MEIRFPPSAENASTAVRDALAAIPAGEPSALRFEKATYHFWREGAHRGVFHPTNSSVGEKYVPFPILGPPATARQNRSFP